MKLYEIKDEFKSLSEMTENDCEYDAETGEVVDNSEILKKLFDELTLNFGDKLDGCAYIVSSLTVQAKTLKDEAKRLGDRAKRLERNAESLEGMMLSALLQLPEQKLKTLRFTFSTRKSEQVIIEEGFNMAGNYVRVKETWEPDKVAIKAAIKEGANIIGATLVTNQSLTIK